MTTALLILALVVVLVSLVGVCCQIAGGGFWAIFHLFNGSIGNLAEVIGLLLVAILDGLNS